MRKFSGSLIFALCLAAMVTLAVASDADEAISLNNRGIAALNAGKFRDAIKLLQMATDMKPGDTVILQNLAMAMNNQAVFYLSDTRPDMAVGWLLRAMDVFPDETISKNLSQAYIQKGHAEAEAGRPELAQQQFRNAITANPYSSQAHEWLGRNLYDEGRLVEAAKSVDQAYQLDPRPELGRFLDKIKREKSSEQNFFEQRTFHFRISYSPDIQSGHVTRVSSALDRAYQDHRIFLGGAPKTEIQAVLYSSHEKFAGTHELTSNVAGIYDGKVRMPIPDNPSWDALERTLSHEVAHAFLFDIGGADIPLWLNEGLAELLSAGPDRPTSSLDRAVALGSPLIPLRDLTATLKNLRNNTTAALAYDQSYSIAKFIHARFGVFGMRRLLQAIKEGADEETAIQRALFMNREMLRQNWISQLK